VVIFVEAGFLNIIKMSFTLQRVNIACILLTVLQVLLTWMIWAWKSHEVLSPSVLIGRDVAVTKWTVICC
jgi:hypothetical protein